MNRTLPAALVFRVLVQDPAVPRYGFELTARTGVRAGTLYPLMQRFESAGLITSEFEKQAARSRRTGPLRRYYRLTPAGEEYARVVLEDLADRLALAGFSPVSGSSGGNDSAPG